ncbi:hypothetical protein ACP275_08G124000 [Erythranthe tilingii]
MARPWFSVDKKEDEEESAVVGFLRRVAAVMGVFFSCFRIKDLSSTPEPLIARNKHTLSSLFLPDDNSHGNGGQGWNSLPEEVHARELKDEAKFLKACGTLLETPVEIRNALRECVDTSAQKEVSPNFSPSASIEKLKLEKQSDESPKPVKICEEWVTGSGSLVDSSSSSMTDRHNTRRDSINSIQSNDVENVVTPTDVPDNGTQSPGVFATSVKCKNKSVRFECQSDSSSFSSESSGQYSGSAGNSSVSKPSPYPTPLKLTEEMQTPGTAFPTFMNNLAGGKPNRVRSQYVYSFLNPIDYPSQLKESEEDHLRESPKPNEEATLLLSPTLDRVTEENSAGKDCKNEASLSSWLKPTRLTNEDGNMEQIGAENVNCGTSPGDRPILGMVAVHWNDDGNSHVSPKWWDGNGIPNTTNKYKEDQKVSWHATPFEERLEKALSDDTITYQRKPMSGNGTPPKIEFNEAEEESDTASSEVQSSSSTHVKSIASF